MVDRGESLFVTRLLVTSSFHLLVMPPKTARKCQIESSLQKAREAKRLRESGEGTQWAVAESDPRQQQYKDDLSGLLHTSDEALDTDNESIDPDFIDEKNGYLQLTQEEYDKAKNDSTITRFARELFEYGEAKEGYWTADKLMKQIKAAVKIAEAKYPKCEGYRLVWIFDHSSCHAAMPDDALDASKMNVNPGGKQRVMRNGYWNGQPQSMNFALGIPKGM